MNPLRFNSAVALWSARGSSLVEKYTTRCVLPIIAREAREGADRHVMMSA